MIEYHIIRETLPDGTKGEWHVPNQWWQMLLYLYGDDWIEEE